ncbi:MAG TPA: hypothetical protein VFR18_08145 [Terriglobia bacterium]|nr:hypothetical protein [Terriglobia bacterium]
MVDRRMLATGVLALLVAMSQIERGHGQGAQGGQGAGTPQAGGAEGRGAGAAQGRGGGGRGGRGSAFTPATGAKDLKSVLFNWTWHMGMLRSGNESELVKTLDYHAEGGTVQVNGQPCALTKYRVQANYQTPGYRTQIECTLPNKQAYKNVETMSGDYAWDEDIPGAELVPGQGKATPRPDTMEERRIRLWASPHGAPKAAIAGAAGLPPSESFGQNPAVLLDRQAAAGAKSTTTLSWQGDKAIITYPIPGVPGATATATLNNFLPERVVVKSGTNTTEFVYGNFQDFNNPLFKIEALYASTIVERRNGTVVRDVKSKVTEIGQVYVVVPVPDSVQKAGRK